MIAQVDTLPMLADEKPLLPVAPVRTTRRLEAAAAPGKSAAPAVPPESLGVGQRLLQTWSIWSQEMWDDVRQLIRVRSVDTPEALMLSPSESYFVRENLKLRLLNARLALLSRNETTFRDDLVAAQDAAGEVLRHPRPHHADRRRRCCARCRPTTWPSKCRRCPTA